MSTSPTLRSLGVSSPAQDAAMMGSGRLSTHEASPATPEQTMQPEADGPPSYVEADDDELMPPPNFAPFFAVIEDTATGEHYHPSVHYIFADDDQEIITAAAIRELGHDDLHGLTFEDGSSQPAIPLLPPPIPGTKERYILLDGNPDGHTIAEVQSLSKEWQVTDVSIRPAPTWDEETDSGAGAFMLKIGGVEVSQTENSAKADGAAALAEARQDASGDLLNALDNLFQKFEKELESTTRLLSEVDHASTVDATRTRTGSLGGA